MPGPVQCSIDSTLAVGVRLHIAGGGSNSSGPSCVWRRVGHGDPIYCWLVVILGKSRGSRRCGAAKIGVDATIDGSRATVVGTGLVDYGVCKLCTALP